jgi:hypothetical protein
MRNFSSFISMPKKRSEAASKCEELVQEVLLGIANKKWNSIYVAANALNIPPSTLYNRSQEGAKSRSEAHIDQQSLTAAEERELVKWVRSLELLHNTQW